MVVCAGIFEMRRKLFLLSVLALAGTWITSAAIAEGQSPRHSSGGTSFVDRLGQLRNKLIGDVLGTSPDEQADPPAPGPQTRQFTPATVAIRPASPRAGSVVGTDSEPRQAVAPSASSNPVPSTERRLHERLTVVRRSPFGEDDTPESPKPEESVPERPSNGLRQPRTTGLPIPTPLTSSPGVGSTQRRAIPHEAASPTPATGPPPSVQSTERPAAPAQDTDGHLPPAAGAEAKEVRPAPSTAASGDNNVLFKR